MFFLGLIVLALLVAFLCELRQRPTGAVTPGLHEEIELPHNAEWEIYQNSISLCSKKLRVCMEELELPHVSHPIDLIETGSYENLSRHFLKVNPAFTVPVLVHGGHPVYESHEQIVYAAEHAGERGAELLGATPELREQVARWVDHGAIKGDPLKGGHERAGHNAPGLTIPIFTTMIAYIPWWRIAEGLLFHGDRRRPLLFAALKALGIYRLPPPALKAIAAARENMEAHLDELEEVLGDGRSWNCGESFTLADVSWMAILERIEEVDWTDLFLGDEKRPRVSAYLGRLQERPSYAAAMGERSEIAIRALEDLRQAKQKSPELRLALEGR